MSAAASRDAHAFAARNSPRSGAREAVTAARVVWVAVAVFSVLFIFAAVLHYEVFLTPHGDLGNMVQAIWNTAHGHFLQVTTASGRQESRLAAHVDPFLLLFVPFFWAGSLLLPIVQAVAVASGALPVFWLARKHLDSPRAGAHFALAYLLYPATQFNAFTITSSFHSVALAVPLVLYAIWFLDEDRLVAFSVVALLACTTKEEIPLAVGCLGIWYAVRTGRRAFGLGVFTAGLALTLFNFLWVIPHFAPNGVDPFAHRYSAVGRTPGGMAHKLFTDPGAFMHAVATGHKAFYVAVLFIPFLGLCFLEPLLLLGAVPDLAINLLSDKPDQTAINYHWTAGIVPFVVAASIFGVARFRSKAVPLSLWVLVVAGCLALWSPVYLGLRNDVRALGSPTVSAKAHAVGLVPSGVPVSATNQLGGRLSERRYSYMFPAVGRARRIVVDVNDPTQSNSRRAFRRYESSKDWRTVYSSRGITVLHRRS